MPISKRRTAVESSTTVGPYWQSDCGRAAVYVGDCLSVMPLLGRDRFHAVVTDPPYGLGKEPDIAEVMESWLRRGYHEVGGTGFMGKKWDAFVPQPATWQECVATMKPGAHALCFAGTRTLDWMGMALRFAGLQIRDLIMYCYGSGYPKGTNVSKAVDKALGAKRNVTRTPMAKDGNVWMDAIGASRPWKERAKEVGYHEHDDDNPVTDEARQWQGWNTSLKPALEPIILARKSLPGTVAECAMDHATGALNVDACRVGTTQTIMDIPIGQYKSSGSGIYRLNSKEAGSVSMKGNYRKRQMDGRWPANLMHDGSDEVVGLFPECASSSAVMPLPKAPGDCLGHSHDRETTEEYWKQGGGGFSTVGRSTLRGFDDSGSAARFFYTTKADDDDRPHGKGKGVTTHPTVKPLDLMRYLVRLVCVPGGEVLDPFMGSGSTGCAAILEGMRFVGIEQSPDYADVAVGRIKLALAERSRAADPPTTRTATAAASAPPPARRMRGR